MPAILAFAGFSCGSVSARRTGPLPALWD